jgi:hypothetical protein
MRCVLYPYRAMCRYILIMHCVPILSRSVSREVRATLFPDATFCCFDSYAYNNMLAGSIPSLTANTAVLILSVFRVPSLLTRV